MDTTLSRDRDVDSPARRRVRILMLLANPCDPDWRVMKEASALAATGNEVTILAWDRSGELPQEAVHGGARISRMRSWSNMNGVGNRLLTAIRYWRATVKAAKEIPFDVVHCHDLPTLPVGLYLKARRRVPIVYDAHEMYWLMLSETQPPPFVWVLRVVERIMMRFADRVITVSELLADYFRDHHRHVVVVGNWYDPTEPDRVAGLDLRHTLGISDDQTVIASIGSLGPERLYGLLVEYARGYPDIAVVIAGQGVGASEIAQAAGSIPNLHFLGWQSDPKPVYAAADTLFYGLEQSDRYSQVSSPNTLFLSIAMRIPLIATPTGDAGRILLQTGAGKLLEEITPGSLDKAVRALAEPAQRNEVRARLADLQPTYSWRGASHTLVATYATLVPATGGTSGELQGPVIESIK